MWFFVAVLILWGSTAYYGEWDPWVLPPVAAWAWWTFHLYLVAAAALSESFMTLGARVMGVMGYTLLVIYYTTMSATYMTFLPADATNVDLWPTIFMMVNLVGPLLLVTAACVAPAVQRRG